MHKECLYLRQRHRGPNNAEVLKSMNNLAEVYYCQGKLELALDLCIKCYGKRKEKLGEKHFETMFSLNFLATIYHTSYNNDGSCDNDNYIKAKSKYLECYEIRRRNMFFEIRGNFTVHPDTLITLSNLALLYKQKGLFDESHSRYLECYEKYKLILGENDAITIEAKNDLDNYNRIDSNQKPKRRN
jgi:tetratricopeptide (TPR) repeat protein